MLKRNKKIALSGFNMLELCSYYLRGHSSVKATSVRKRGFTLVEVMVAIGVFAVVASALVGTVMYGLKANKAIASRQAALEAARRIYVLVHQGGMLELQSDGNLVTRDWFDGSYYNDIDEDFELNSRPVTEEPFGAVMTSYDANGVRMEDDVQYVNMRRRVLVDILRDNPLSGEPDPTTEGSSIAVIRVDIRSEDLTSPVTFTGFVEL